MQNMNPENYPAPSARMSLIRSAVLTAVSVCSIATVSAQSSWTGSVNNDWTDPGNWSAGVPDGVDANINTTGPNTATILSNVTQSPQQLLVGNGSGADGLLVVDSGSISVNADLAVGMNGGTGDLTVNGGAITTGGWNRIGRDGNGSQGVLTMNGGSLTNGSFTFVGTGDTTGELFLSGGDYINNGTFVIAEGNNANGAVTINHANSKLEVSGELWLGNANTGTTNGVLNLGAGEIAVNNWFNVGRQGGTGELNVTGGLINKTGGGMLTVGGGPGGSGVINHSGGTINSVSTQFQVGQDFGGGGSGTYTLSGTGVGNFENVILGSNNSNGTVNLDGGELNTRQIIGGNGTKIVNLDGGTLGATTNEAVFFDMAGGRANVRDGGAVIDSGGFDVTIGQALEHSDIVGDAAVDGGLTKQGGGTLTLNAVNTYTGTTTVTEGTLALGASGSIGSSAGVSLDGGILDVSALVGGYALGSAQTLGGTGSVVGDLRVDGDLAIGNSPGTMGFQTLTVGGTLVYEVVGGTTGPGSADLGQISETLTLDGAALDLVQIGTFAEGDKFTLFAYDVFNGGEFNGLADGDVFNSGGGQWRIDYDDPSAGTNGGTGAGFVTITAIPEPGVVSLVGLAGLALLGRRKRA